MNCLFCGRDLDILSQRDVKDGLCKDCQKYRGNYDLYLREVEHRKGVGYSFEVEV